MVSKDQNPINHNIRNSLHLWSKTEMLVYERGID